MSEISTKQLLRDADDALRHARCDPRRLTSLHIGITAAACLAVALLNYFLDLRIADIDGLGGLGALSMLQTVQSVAQSALTILSPFWAFGYTAVAIGFARRQAMVSRDLTKGFLRWGPVLRFYILQYALYFALAFAAMQLGSMIYCMSPASAPLLELIESADTLDTAELISVLQALDTDAMSALLLTMLPFLLIPVVIVLVPAAYLLRFAEYVLMDEPRCGAFHAAAQSFRLCKRNWRHLLKLDIRFLWFYLAQALVLALSYGNTLLALCGVSLQLDETILSLLFYSVALIAQYGLYVWKKPRVATCYALLYDRILPPRQDA